jgi:hypothetical protein
MEQVSYIHVDSRSRDTALYPFSNTYTIFLNKPITNVTRIDLVSAIVTNPFSTGNAYIWLDITELRTPTTYSGSKLVLANFGSGASGVGSVQMTQPSVTSPTTSFAIIPLDVAQNSHRTFREASDYAYSIRYPSRLDSIDRLTIRWLDYQGTVVNFGNAQTYDPNSFVLRVHTQIVPTFVDRITRLPPPVREGLLEDKPKVYVAAFIALVVGLMMIMLVRNRR